MISCGQQARWTAGEFYNRGIATFAPAILEAIHPALPDMDIEVVRDLLDGGAPLDMAPMLAHLDAATVRRYVELGEAVDRMDEPERLAVLDRVAKMDRQKQRGARLR